MCSQQHPWRLGLGWTFTFRQTDRHVLVSRVTSWLAFGLEGPFVVCIDSSPPSQPRVDLKASVHQNVENRAKHDWLNGIYLSLIRNPQTSWSAVVGRYPGNEQRMTTKQTCGSCQSVTGIIADCCVRDWECYFAAWCRISNSRELEDLEISPMTTSGWST